MYQGCTGEHAVILFRYEKDTQERKQYCQTHYDRIRFAEMSQIDARRDREKREAYIKGRKALFAKLH